MGDGTGSATIQSEGNHNLVLQTGNASTPSITIVDGAGTNIIADLPSAGFLRVQGRVDNLLTTTSSASDLDLGLYRLFVAPVAGSAFQYTGERLTVENTTSGNLTNATFGLLGHDVTVEKSNTGTVTSMGGYRVRLVNSALGVITNAIGLSVEPSNTGGGTFTLATGIAFKDTGSMPTSVFAFDFEGTDWVSNGRAVSVADDAAQRYMPLSTADTGITFDSTDLILATTTSGNVILDPITEVDIRGGQKVARVAVADVNHTALVSEYLIAYTSITATRTVSLPPAATAGAGKVFTVNDESGSVSGAVRITIDPSGIETIDGALTFDMIQSYESVSFYSDGSNWFII